MLYIDGNAVVYNNNFQAATQATGLANLTPGLHTIDVEYYQGGGGCRRWTLQWDPTGGNNFVDIPNSAFSSIQAVNGLSNDWHRHVDPVENQHLFRVNHDRRRHPGRDGEWCHGTGHGHGHRRQCRRRPGLYRRPRLHHRGTDHHQRRRTGRQRRIENIERHEHLCRPYHALTGAATIGSDAGTLTLARNISVGANSLTVLGAGATTINGNIICQGGSVTLAASGTINIAGNIDLGPLGNLTDSGSGQATISGAISGTATSGFAQVQGLIGTYFNLTAAQDLIQPADPGNSAWLGNQTPAVTAQLVGPIDFPDIADNGFADSVGDPAYYNLGPGNNDNVEARWYGDIMIPGTGTAPVPINFATTSDDGSMLYIDGNAVVDNNNFQGATQATGMADLTPGLHTIDVEYYQGGCGATMDAAVGPHRRQQLRGYSQLRLFLHPARQQPDYDWHRHVDPVENQHLFRVNHDRRRHPGRDGEWRHGTGHGPGIVVNAGGALAFSGGLNYTTAEPITITAPVRPATAPSRISAARTPLPSHHPVRKRRRLARMPAP